MGLLLRFDATRGKARGPRMGVLGLRQFGGKGRFGGSGKLKREDGGRESFSCGGSQWRWLLWGKKLDFWWSVYALEGPGRGQALLGWLLNIDLARFGCEPDGSL